MRWVRWEKCPLSPAVFTNSCKANPGTGRFSIFADPAIVDTPAQVKKKVQKKANSNPATGDNWLKMFIYSSLLFLLAVGLLLAIALRNDVGLTPPDMGSAIFFYLFSLYTITAGYTNKSFGYVSMDRVGQISNLLLFGPFYGAIINGLASFTFAWFRLFKGVPLRNTLNAVLVNSGMMSIMSLAGGYTYICLGGRVPAEALSMQLLVPLFATLLVMQVINEMLIAGMSIVRGMDFRGNFSVYATGIELLSGIIGLLVALMYTQQDLALFGLFMLVLVLGMLVQRQYALIRQNLEGLVEERTRELEAKSEELRKQAIRDHLTGLFNRRYANDYLQKEIARSKRQQRPFSIAMLDIDHFKQINDQYLHDTGDRVLQHIAQLLESNTRESDLVARYGGEEFLLYFPDTELSGACTHCEALRKIVAQEDWTNIRPGIRTTVSIGVTQGTSAQELADLLRCADTSLYEAKHEGRNRVCCQECTD